MKKIWLYTVRSYITLGLFFYYRRIQVKHVDKVPSKGPVLFVSNHNNALMDALLIATQSGRFSYFLTRASVFKKPLVNALLRSLNMLPVYRKRDGWNTVANNTAIFENCSRCLNSGEVVALFPEGNHHINRTVRPLSKGFTRIVFETMERFPETDLKLIPIGLNYEQADAFADSVSLYFGSEILAKDYMHGDKTTEINRLKSDVWMALTQLTSHISADNYDININKLKSLHADFLNPEVVNVCMASQFQNCTFRKKKQPKKIKAFFKLLLIVLLIVPYGIWKGIAEPKVKEVEFVATFRFAMAISLVPIWMAILFVILLLSLGLTYAVVYVFLALLFSLLAVKL
ncbi:lysophospholipid acyltransferase family protein [Bizionia psychrotolerans]|uniref:lysophospholipid acyltransferase family protein n=1 Tax=Bizionia psychrotolerans TaxID=1492901 RepID=UPI000A6522F3|nr:lysophospholipid acyltransferase family protein [Bizionia psychrotolerans]